MKFDDLTQVEKLRLIALYGNVLANIEHSFGASIGLTKQDIVDRCDRIVEIANSLKDEK